MSIRALNWAFKQDLPPGERFMLVALADYADEDGSCFPGQAKLAAKTGYDIRTVRRLLAALEERGRLRRAMRYAHGGRRTSNRYFLVLGDEESLEDNMPSSDAGPAESPDTDAPLEDTGAPLEGTTPPEPSENPSDNPQGVGARARDRTLAPDFVVPKKWIAEAAAEVDGVDVEAEALRFPHWARANGVRSADWRARWLLFVLRGDGARPRPAAGTAGIQREPGASGGASPVASLAAEPPKPEKLAEGAWASWKDVRQGLRAELGDATYRSWIQPLTLLHADEHGVRVAAPSPFHRDRIESRYADALRKHCGRSFGTAALAIDVAAPARAAVAS